MFTQTNNASANAVLVLSSANDQLVQVASVPTGGTGSGGGLQNQSSLALNEDGSLLLVSNAGSDDFSVFAVNGPGLTLVGRTAAGGRSPVSLAIARGVVFVLSDGSRAGQSDSISAFTITAAGRVTPVPGSTRLLSQPATGAAQVALSPDATLAVVTERSTAVIDTFAVDPQSGLPGPAIVNASSGAIPFGFQFHGTGHIFVSEEGTNGVSSYSFAAAHAQPITRSAANHQSATCWLAITPSGKFLYTTNTTADSISEFAIGEDSSVRLVGSSGRAATSSGPPIDAIVSPDGTALFVVNASQGIYYFRIAGDGSLSLVQNFAAPGVTLNGIVAL